MDDLEERVFGQLPDETWVYPGHGDDTTLGRERPNVPEWRARGCNRGLTTLRRAGRVGGADAWSASHAYWAKPSFVALVVSALASELGPGE
jgi:glyoxylase-like metal-dependent hydrolase (beta-lactamase superfamily II)